MTLALCKQPAQLGYQQLYHMPMQLTARQLLSMKNPSEMPSEKRPVSAVEIQASVYRQTARIAGAVIAWPTESDAVRARMSNTILAETVSISVWYVVGENNKNIY